MSRQDEWYCTDCDSGCIYATDKVGAYTTCDTGPSVVRILVHAEEEDLVGGLVVDEEGERVVGDELRVEERPRRPEPEERRGGGRLAPLLVHLDERLVQRAVLVFSNVGSIHGSNFFARTYSKS